jgi:hypothetical protein
MHPRAPALGFALLAMGCADVHAVRAPLAPEDLELMQLRAKGGSGHVVYMPPPGPGPSASSGEQPRTVDLLQIEPNLVRILEGGGPAQVPLVNVREIGILNHGAGLRAGIGWGLLVGLLAGIVVGVVDGCDPQRTSCGDRRNAAFYWGVGLAFPGMMLGGGIGQVSGKQDTWTFDRVNGP